MELLWLEDFLELAATRNFSTAAAARNVSQPAFSRRIRALENWVGAELIDRSKYPISLTGVGSVFLQSGRQLARDIYRIREDCRRQAALEEETLSFSALHSIALCIFPDLLRKAEEKVGPCLTRMDAANFHDCIEAIAVGRCNFALSYSHPEGPLILPTGQFVSKKIAVDPFVLMSARTADGAPRYSLEAPSDGACVPLIAYTSDSFLGKMQALVRDAMKPAPPLKTVFENSMSESIKRMVLAGRGVGWMPLSTVGQESEGRRLAMIGGAETRLDLDVMIFRRAGVGSKTMERFWNSVPEYSPDLDHEAGSSPAL